MFPRNVFPQGVGSAWEIDAPAKLNLYLEILGAPINGFHPLETLMVPVRIYDQLRWTAKAYISSPSQHIAGCTLRIRNWLTTGDTGERGDTSEGLLSSGKDNLVLRAANLLAQVAGIEPYGAFELNKRIPMQAGLGGGSSDAAAALLLANQGWGLRYSRQRLIKIAADLGSDVPYFLSMGAAVCRGRGERIKPVAGLPRLNFVIVKPPLGLSTAEVFSRLSQVGNNYGRATSALPLLLESLRQGAISQASQWMTNRLEQSAEQLTPWIDRLRNVFANFGCYAHLMTGSGSSYIGIMRSAKQARRVARQIAGMKLGNVFATASC